MDAAGTTKYTYTADGEVLTEDGPFASDTVTNGYLNQERMSLGDDKIGQLTIADSTVNTEDRGYFYDTAWNLNRRTNNGVTGTFSVDN